MSLRRSAALACVLAGVAAAPAAAQSPASFSPKQLVVSAGLLASRGYAIGDRTADLRRNATSPATFPLFRAESAIESAPGLDARLAFALSRAFSVEVGGTISRPQLAVRISQDGEGAPETEASESLGQFTVEVSGLWHFPRGVGPRARPYLVGGAGYIRQLHEERYLVETGNVAFGGGGLHYWFRPGGPRRRALGVRGEAAIVVRNRGIDFEDKRRAYPRLSALGFIGF